MARRLKGRYISDEKYFYIQKPAENGMEEIVRFPHKELDVVEVAPNPKRWNERSKAGYISKNYIISSASFGLPVVGILWALGVFNSVIAFIIYWVVTFIFVGTVVVANCRKLEDAA